MRDPKHPRQFTEEFRRQIVALVDSGKPRADVLRGYDLGKSTLDRWIRRVHACGCAPRHPCPWRGPTLDGPALAWLVRTARRQINSAT